MKSEGRRIPVVARSDGFTSLEHCTRLNRQTPACRTESRDHADGEHEQRDGQQHQYAMVAGVALTPELPVLAEGLRRLLEA